MKTKEEKKDFVIELPLKVEKWQEHLLNKRCEFLRDIYNYVQDNLLRQFGYFEQMSEWKSCKTKKSKGKFLESHPFTIKGFDTPITFTKYGISNFVSKLCQKKVSREKKYKDFGLNSMTLQQMGLNVWSAWNKKIYDKPRVIKNKETGEIKIKPYEIHFKKRGGLNTIFFGKSNNYFIGLEIDFEHMILYYNINGKQGKNKQSITLPIVFNKPTEYEMFAFKGGYETVKLIKIVRKLIRGRYKFYVQFTIEGEKPQKGRTLGKGVVGIDVGPSTVAVSSLNGVQINTLAEKCDDVYHKCKLLGRKMDRSRRATNPQNYNDDGTIKKDEKLEWNYSKRYLKVRNKRCELLRKQAAIRKLQHNIDTNELLRLGDTFVVEKNPISAWQQRGKKIKINKRGRIQTNKRFGKSIANHAPAMFITILENKVKSLGGEFKRVPIENGASRFDFTNSEFVEHGLSERKITLSNGNVHQRDMIAAYNLQHLNYNSEELKDYNIEDMKKDYPIFCELEKMEIDKYISGQKKSHKSTVGY